MKLVAVFSTAVLSLALGAAVPAFTQDHEQEDKAKPAQDEKKAEPEKPAKQEQKSAQQEKNTRPEEKSAPQKQEQHATTNRIPADRYKANFGQQHTFRVSQGDYNNHRFQYGGYSFGFVGVWPGNWLYTQNVYVIEINGVYYLCNPMYPGVNLELSFTI
jgi:hypothetical protein